MDMPRRPACLCLVGEGLEALVLAIDSAMGAGGAAPDRRNSGAFLACCSPLLKRVANCLAPGGVAQLNAREAAILRFKPRLP